MAKRPPEKVRVKLRDGDEPTGHARPVPMSAAKRAEWRAGRLAEIRAQVESGELVIRRATDEERASWVRDEDGGR